MTDDDRPSEQVDELMAEREYDYPGLKQFFEADTEYAERYDGVAEHVLRNDSELDRKTRELIIVAFACSNGRVGPCERHLRLALKYGASELEVYQTIQLAGHVGGAWSIVTGSKAFENVLRLDDDEP